MKTNQEKIDTIEVFEYLCTLVADANRLYRAGAESFWSDAEYDHSIHMLREASKEHPEWGTSKDAEEVGDDSTEGFKKVEHAVPMLSIDDVFEKKPSIESHDEGNEQFYDFSEAEEWCEKLLKAYPHLDQHDITIEHKLDGCAITLFYEDGILKYAATRGNGKTGDDITENAKRIEGIPTLIPYSGKLEIRGEVLMSHASFDRVNEEQREAGLKEFANPRNLTAGTIKSLDPDVVSKRGLMFIAYEISTMENVRYCYNLPGGSTTEGWVMQGRPLEIDTNSMDTMRAEICYECGMKVVPSISMSLGWYNHKNELNQRLSEIEWSRNDHELDYDIDGAVIKIDDPDVRKQLGCTSRAPRWACAVKFLPEQVATVVESIDLQVGRTGVVTPVANLTPVRVSGSTVARATLHNQDEINRLGVRVGSTVLLEKAGDIIPSITLVCEYGTQSNKPFDIMEETCGRCPECGEPLERKEGEVAIKCSNPYCTGKNIAKLIHMCSRQALDISGIGEAAATALVDSGLVGSLLDLFTISKDELANLNISSDEGSIYKIGEKTATKIMAAIESAKTAPLSRWLVALGIPGVGKTVAESLAKKYASITSIALAGFNIEDIAGRATTESIVSWFNNKYTDEYILSRLPGLGISPTPENVEAVFESDRLKDEVVVITGKLSHPRDYFVDKIKANGGTFGKSITGATTILVVGEKAGSKLKKAEDLGVCIITEEEFDQMLTRDFK